MQTSKDISESIGAAMAAPFKPWRCARCGLEVETPDCHREAGFDAMHRLEPYQERLSTAELEKRYGLRVLRNPYGPGAWLSIPYCTGTFEPNPRCSGLGRSSARVVG